MGLLDPRLQEWVRLGETEGGVKSTCVCVCVCVCVSCVWGTQFHSQKQIVLELTVVWV